ncbi:MAG: HAD family phosphatase [Bacilli bacterium]
MKSLYKYKAILFDMDGVLLDSESIYLEALKKYLLLFSIKVKQEQLVKYIGKPIKNITKNLIKDFNLSTDEKTSIEKQIELYDEIFYLPGKVKAMPYLENLLQSLRNNKIKTALVSSSSKSGIEMTLNILQFKHKFNVIISGEDVIKGKPASECYDLALSRLNLDAEDCLVIEDSKAGITAGKSAGMEVIAFCGSKVKQDVSKADLIINSFKSLINLEID